VRCSGIPGGSRAEIIQFFSGKRKHNKDRRKQGVHVGCWEIDSAYVPRSGRSMHGLQAADAQQGFLERRSKHDT